jgi:hypothetical protein
VQPTVQARVFHGDGHHAAAADEPLDISGIERAATAPVDGLDHPQRPILNQERGCNEEVDGCVRDAIDCGQRMVMARSRRHDARLLGPEDRCRHAIRVREALSAHPVSRRSGHSGDDELVCVCVVEEDATGFRSSGVGRVRSDPAQELIEIEKGRKSFSGWRRSAEVPGVRSHDACIVMARAPEDARTPCTTSYCHAGSLRMHSLGERGESIIA